MASPKTSATGIPMPRPILIAKEKLLDEDSRSEDLCAPVASPVGGLASPVLVAVFCKLELVGDKVGATVAVACESNSEEVAENDEGAVPSMLFSAI